MKRTQWIGAALALVSIAMFAAFSTNPAIGTANRFWFHASSTGAIGGKSTPLGTGFRYLSIGTFAGGITGANVQIWSSSILNGTDTLAVVGSWSGSFARGVDSLHVITNGAGMSVTVSK